MYRLVVPKKKDPKLRVDSVSRSKKKKTGISLHWYCLAWWQFCPVLFFFCVRIGYYCLCVRRYSFDSRDGSALGLSNLVAVIVAAAYCAILDANMTEFVV